MKMKKNIGRRSDFLHEYTALNVPAVNSSSQRQIRFTRE